MTTNYPFAISPRLAAKVGSLIVHVDEALSPGGHEFDWTATRALLTDSEVVEWLRALQKMTLVPLKRNL